MFHKKRVLIIPSLIILIISFPIIVFGQSPTTPEARALKLMDLSGTGWTAAVERTIYVDDDAAGVNDGSSWTDAYKYLQDALADASSAEKPVEIRVAQGVYKPDRRAATPEGAGQRGATFEISDGVILRGGYGGFGEADPNVRDINKYKSVLSGDLADNDVEIEDPCDLLGDPSRSENSWHVVWGRQGTYVLDGFSISGGNANYGNNEHRWGGGMLNFGRNATVVNCTFCRNSATGIGGAMVRTGTVVNCVFSNNWAYSGGAIWDDSAWRMHVSNCTFVGNAAVSGGAIYLIWAISARPLRADTLDQVTIYEREPAIVNCVFWGNRAQSDAGGLSQIYMDPFLERGMVTYSCIQGWTGTLGGVGNMGDDPFFADPNNGDYHLRSQAGRWDENEGRWTKDEVTSPCIDAGDMSSPIGHEPFPNGGVINMGAYGGTAGASKSYFGEPVCETIIAGDINGDCKVDSEDLAIMLFHWLEER